MLRSDPQIPIGFPAMEGMAMRSGEVKILFLCTGNSCRSQMAEGGSGRLWGSPDMEAFIAEDVPSERLPDLSGTGELDIPRVLCPLSI